MTSGTSRKIRVAIDREEAGKIIWKLWKGLPYKDKKLKSNELPKELWGTFQIKGPGSVMKKYNRVHYFASISKDGKNSGWSIIKIEAVIPDPIFGQGALKIVARDIFLLAKHFKRRNISVESVWQLFGPNLII